MRIELKK